MNEDQVQSAALAALGEALGASVRTDCPGCGAGVALPTGAGRLMADLVASDGEHQFLVEVKRDSSSAQVGAALRQLALYHSYLPDTVPVLAVAYMGEVGKKLCEASGVSWFDLSGNADIRAPGLRVKIAGQPNRYKRRGRHENLFSPRGSRIARALLLSPEASPAQGELAEATGLTPGMVSQLIRRYQEAGFVTRQTVGRKRVVQLTDYGLLLDAWYQSYNFSMHEVRRGHVGARTTLEALKRLAQAFERHGVDYAATGLAAAWLIEPFAAFNLITVYVRGWPAQEVLDEAGFRDEPRGSNVWLVWPRDEDVFRASEVKGGIRHVSAVQTYLDLKAQPERSEEAAEELRKQHLKWSGPHGD